MKFSITIILVFCACFCFGQITKDSLLTKMSKEACIALGKKDINKMDKSNLEQEIGLLIMPVMMSNMSDIEKVYGGTIKDLKGMEKVGMDLGMKLVLECPDFMKFSMELAQDEPLVNKIKKKKEDATATEYRPPVLVGETENEKYTLVSVNPGDITSLTVKNNKGKVEKIYWMEYFENADELKTNAKKYIGKKVVIATSNKDVYNAATKNYKSIKIIESLELVY
jgi:hypothetical protein